MSVWEQYTKEQRDEYVKFLQVYGALTNLFRQKKGDLIPYLDSKFQETVFAKTFQGVNVDIRNTPHDVLSIFGDKRVGIGLKTFMNSKPSYQKVMQIKSYQQEINGLKNDIGAIAYRVAQIKNEKMISDYNRLGLSENNNIYHYVTRDKGSFTINECAYPLIDIKNLKDFKKSSKSFTWSDGIKDYKYTFGDSQIWQKFDSEKYNSIILNRFNVDIIKNPFDFLLKAYLEIIDSSKVVELETIEVYLPLYSYKNQEVKDKSGLNAWNAAPKAKGSNKPRPLNEIYIPVPIEVHRKHPGFFCDDILPIIETRKGPNKQEVRFHLQLPNGKKIPALLTGDNLKNVQGGSNTEKDENGKRYGQDALGQWLLIDVLGLKERKRVTMEWLESKGTDSIRLWRNANDYNTIYIDFAPIGSFESFMDDEPME